MKINKAVNIELLQKELRDAGVPFRGITAWFTDVDGEIDIFDHDKNGVQIDPSPAAIAIIEAHNAPPEPPTPDFGNDEPDSNFRAQAATAVAGLRNYMNLETAPTPAQRIAWERLVCRILLFLIRYVIAPPPVSVPIPAPMQFTPPSIEPLLLPGDDIVANMIARGEFAGAGGSATTDVPLKPVPPPEGLGD
jgi:hypothetical protein